jgi:hypothetical protein
LIHGPSHGCTPAYGRIRIKDCGFEGDPRQERLIQVSGARFDRLELSQVVFAHEKPSLIRGDLQDGQREVLIENLVIGGKKAAAFDSAGIELENIRKSEMR